MIVTINGDNSYAIISSVGGTVHRFVCNGKEVIFPFLTVDDKSRGGIPICFPFFGPPTQRFQTIPQHGWLRHEELRLIQASDTTVSFAGANKKSEAFPWLLEYRVIIKIELDGLVLRLFVKRLKDGHFVKLPINPAFHPYFWSNPDSNDRCIARCLARVGGRIITEYSKQSWKCPVNSPILINSGTQTVKMTLDGDFNQNSSLTHWSDNPDAFFCTEPKLTDEDAFDDPDAGSFLGEDETMEISMRLAVV